jgi:C-terminal processing protease CtpA/Prc
MAGLKGAAGGVWVPRLRVAGKDDAVVVSSVLARAAAEAGLKSGDRIDEINGNSVSSAADAHKRVASLAGQRARESCGEEKVELKLVAGHGL